MALPLTGSPPRRGGSAQRPRVLLVFVVAEHEPPVLDDRRAGPHAGVPGVERAGVEQQAVRFGADASSLRKR